ncbi:DUF4350 domain-containing protein [Halorhabdus sp. BNX81]|uniref:DUF4350 domain-containing protein n=1 Tax=Halorhabdus sp. BNX81 TaxID=2980181 RepID=UPI0023DD2EF6|nr:DUF4350 domain-containing protein [Halorhabdus sp. BNX81]WEL20586.1 DUF4350 domain-containing protein [Halorhabdus sp. BNX81]
MKRLRNVTVPEAVALALTIAVVVVILFGAATSATAFGAFNYGWDGTADLRAVADATTDSAVLGNTSTYDRLPGNGTLAVVLGPSEPYTSAELERIDAFVRRGGTLLVSGDFGPGANELLAGIKATARIDGTVLRDERNHGRSPAFPLATTVSESAEGRVDGVEGGIDGVDELALNYPSWVVMPNGTDGAIMAETSAYAYADENRDGDLDDEESMRAYPILTRESLENGTVLTLSDPSVFINSMLDRGDNRAFAQALFSASERVRFDYTHSGEVPPLVQALDVIRSSPLAQFLFGTALVGGVVLLRKCGRDIRDRFGRRSPTVEDIELTESEIVDLVSKRHPDWDRDRVTRIATQLAARRSGHQEPVDDDP